MKIKSIHIENVRGLGDCLIPLSMIPNKPSLLVAPNGTGKSSFAFAFQWLNRQRLKLDEDDAYMGRVENLPKMTIETSEPDRTLVADGNKNEIMREFGVAVINSGLKAIMPGRAAGFAMGKAHISVPDIALIDGMPDNVQVTDDFEATYEADGMPVGYYPVINQLLADNGFMASLEEAALKTNKRPMDKIIAFIDRSKDYVGTIDVRHAKIQADDYAEIAAIPSVAYAMEQIRRQEPGDTVVKRLLKAVRMVTLYARKKDDFEARMAYARYKGEEQACRDLFAAIRQTWNNVGPHRDGKKVLLKISDAQRISNGERDILVFIANLYKVRSKFTKENNILVIDEVFDYLDDANLMAAQYYITKLIKDLHDDGKNIFPIILSHLNPDYYNQHYSFKDLKVYYLRPLPHPNASDNMMKLLRRRKELARLAGTGGEEDISKYMLHYHNDYTQDMSANITGCPVQWADITVFKQYCMTQMDNYLLNATYDPLAVCVALREIIESRVYAALSTDDQKEKFLQTHGTPAKLKYAEDEGVDVPELYYLLGNIYNDPMHVDNKSNKLITQTLYSRMENNTVRSMINAVKDNRV